MLIQSADSILDLRKHLYKIYILLFNVVPKGTFLLLEDAINFLFGKFEIKADPLRDLETPLSMLLDKAALFFEDLYELVKGTLITAEEMRGRLWNGGGGWNARL